MRELKMLFRDEIFLVHLISIMCLGYVLGEELRDGNIFTIIILLLGVIAIMVANHLYLKKKYDILEVIERFKNGL